MPKERVESEFQSSSHAAHLAGRLPCAGAPSCWSASWDAGHRNSEGKIEGFSVIPRPGLPLVCLRTPTPNQTMRRGLPVLLLKAVEAPHGKRETEYTGIQKNARAQGSSSFLIHPVTCRPGPGVGSLESRSPPGL